ncbi:hypothetical protein, partial [Paralcaligenes ureilyticus]|uniref:hypothetical protein n=1 Tax=Paralcaligenes ureilyticus TaxID=627131 RepID=UPI001A9E1F63
MSHVVAALVAAKIVDKRSGIYKTPCHPQGVALQATATPIKSTNDPPNIHHTSIVASQGGAGDSGTPRAGPASGMQGVRCLSGTI